MNRNLNRNLNILKGAFTVAVIGAVACLFHPIINLFRLFSPTSLHFLTVLQPYLLFGGLGLWGLSLVVAGIRALGIGHRYTGFTSAGVMVVVWAVTIFAAWYFKSHHVGLVYRYPTLVGFLLTALTILCPLGYFIAVRRCREPGAAFLRVTATGVLVVLICNVAHTVIFWQFGIAKSDLIFSAWAFAVMNPVLVTAVLSSLTLFGFLLGVIGLASNHNFVYELAEDSENDDDLEVEAFHDDDLEVQGLPDGAPLYSSSGRSGRRAEQLPDPEDPFAVEPADWRNYKPQYIDPEKFSSHRGPESEVDLGGISGFRYTLGSEDLQVEALPDVDEPKKDFSLSSLDSKSPNEIDSPDIVMETPDDMPTQIPDMSDDKIETLGINSLGGNEPVEDETPIPGI